MKGLTKILNYLCLFLALIILSDFLYSSNTYKDSITEKTTHFESYHNAGGNSHVSKSIKTSRFVFNCSDTFYETSNVGDSLIISTSYLFNKVNAYQNLKTQRSETFSLRILTGLIVPLLVFLIGLISFKLKNRLSILVFVSQIALVANLMYLIAS